MTESNPTDDATFHPQHVPVVQAKPAHQALFPYFLVMLGTLLVVGLGGVWWFNSDMHAKRETNKLAANNAKLLEDFRREQQQEEFAANREAHARLADSVEVLLSALDELDAAHERWVTRRETLLESDEGKDIAASQELITQFVQLEHAFPVRLPNTKATRARVQPIATESRAKAASDDVAAPPKPELSARIEIDIQQTSDALELIVQANDALEGLVRTADRDGIPPAETSLFEATQQQEDSLDQEILDILDDVDTTSRGELKGRIRAAAEQAAADQADARIEAMERQHDQELADLRREEDEKLRAMREQGERRIELMQKQLDERIAELEGDIKVTEASAKAKKTETDLEAERIAMEAEKERLRQKAKAPEIRANLGALLENGLWQPGQKLDASQPAGPISLSALQGYGALDRSTQGLQKLAMVFIDKDDKMRSRLGRWMPGGKALWTSGIKNGRADAIQKFTKVQDILVELGPILVELGMLAE